MGKEKQNFGRKTLLPIPSDDDSTPPAFPSNLPTNTISILEIKGEETLRQAMKYILTPIPPTSRKNEGNL